MTLIVDLTPRHHLHADKILTDPLVDVSAIPQIGLIFCMIILPSHQVIILSLIGLLYMHIQLNISAE